LEKTALGGNVKNSLTRIGGQVRDWIILAHDRDKQGSLVNVLINPSRSTKREELHY